MGLFWTVLQLFAFFSAKDPDLFYKEYFFRTLDGSQIDSEKTAEMQGYCQTKYLPLPGKYVIAPPAPLVLELLVAKNFGGENIVLSDRASYFTKGSPGGSPGTLAKKNSLLFKEDAGYKVNPHHCNARILLVRRRNLFSCKNSGKQYELFEHHLPYEEAVHFAAALVVNLKKGRLATVNTKLEAACLKKELAMDLPLQTSSVWLGGSFNLDTDEYEWIDGEKVSFTTSRKDGVVEAAAGHPRLLKDFALAMDKEGKVLSKKTSDTLPFLVELETLPHCSDGVSFEVVDLLDRSFVSFETALVQAASTSLYGRKGELASVISEEEQLCLKHLCSQTVGGVWMGARISSVVSSLWIFTAEKFRTERDGTVLALHSIFDLENAAKNDRNVFFDSAAEEPVKNNFFAAWEDGQPEIGNGTNYFVKACGKDGNWFTNSSDRLAFYLVKYGSGLPSAPVVETEAGDKVVRVVFSLFSDGGSDVREVEVETHRVFGDESELARTEVFVDIKFVFGSSEPVLVKELDNQNTYKVRARAKNLAGWSHFGDFSEEVTTKGSPSEPVFYIVEPGDHTLRIFLRAPENDGGAATTSCTVTCERSGFSTQLKLAPVPLVGSVLFKDLQNFVQYELHAFCANAMGIGPVASTKGVPLHPKTVSDFQFLQALHTTARGEGWTIKWILNGNFCNEFGIVCEEGRVVRISLPRNNLVGKLPFSLGNLDKLRELNLADNLLAESIPYSVGGCEALETVYLSNNRFRRQVPITLYALERLRFLYLENNFLTGPFLDERVANWTSLRNLVLSGNSLSGKVSPLIFSLPELQLLRLENNLFSGNLVFPQPPFKSSLVDANFASNYFSGSLQLAPDVFENLVNLNVSDNRLEGVFPTSLAKVDTLRVLDFSLNRFTGLASFYEKAFSLTKLKRLFISDNWLSCPLTDYSGAAEETDWMDRENAVCWCQLSEWSEWSDCYNIYGAGSTSVKKREKQVIEKERNGGYCFPLVQIVACSLDV